MALNDGDDIMASHTEVLMQQATYQAAPWEAACTFVLKSKDNIKYTNKKIGFYIWDFILIQFIGNKAIYILVLEGLES